METETQSLKRLNEESGGGNVLPSRSIVAATKYQYGSSELHTLYSDIPLLDVTCNIYYNSAYPITGFIH